MGTVGTLSSVMQYLILSVVGVSLATVSGQLVAYPNGAVAPYDPNNAAATKEHFAALNEAGAVVNPYFTHAQDLVVPAPLFYGKRSADAQHLVTYPNGAVAPFDPNVALATAQHYAAKGVTSWTPLEGAANVHPAAVPALAYGRKKRSADAQVVVGYPYAAYGYAAHPYALAPFAPLVAHPNGAVVPVEPKDVVDARAEHLAAIAEAGRKKRSADAQVVVGYPYAAYGYAAYPYALAPFAPLVAHPNGAVVPLEPKDVVDARAEHLAAVAEAVSA